MPRKVNKKQVIPTNVHGQKEATENDPHISKEQVEAADKNPLGNSNVQTGESSVGKPYLPNVQTKAPSQTLPPVSDQLAQAPIGQDIPKGTDSPPQSSGNANNQNFSYAGASAAPSEPTVKPRNSDGAPVNFISGVDNNLLFAIGLAAFALLYFKK